MLRGVVSEKGLPASPDAERFVLAWILITGDFAACEAVLGQEDFLLNSHRSIYAAMKTLDQAGKAVDRATVGNELIRTGELESVGGLGYLVDLDSGMPALRNIDSYMDMVREKATLRRIIANCQSTIEKCVSGEAAGDILEHADKILSGLSQRDDQIEDGKTPGQVLNGQPGGLGAFLAPARGGSGIQLPWPAVNEQVCGLQPGDLMVLAGRPSHGKSAAALQITVTAARAGTGVAYFSLEMSQASLTRRMLSMIGRVDSQRIRHQCLDGEERQRLRDAAFEIGDLPITIFERGDYTVSGIRRALKRLQSKQDVGLVVIDHLHLVKSTGNEEERIRFSRIMDEFQRFSKPPEFNVPFLVLAQLNRKCEEENREPQVSDLAETGKIEQNADIVAFTYRPEVYGRNREKPELRGVGKIIIGKQRNGPCGATDMLFEHGYQTFQQAERF